MISRLYPERAAAFFCQNTETFSESLSSFLLAIAILPFCRPYTRMTSARPKRECATCGTSARRNSRRSRNKRRSPQAAQQQVEVEVHLPPGVREERRGPPRRPGRAGVGLLGDENVQLRRRLQQQRHVLLASLAPAFCR